MLTRHQTLKLVILASTLPTARQNVRKLLNFYSSILLNRETPLSRALWRYRWRMNDRNYYVETRNRWSSELEWKGEHLWSGDYIIASFMKCEHSQLLRVTVQMKNKGKNYAELIQCIKGNILVSETKQGQREGSRTRKTQWERHEFVIGNTVYENAKKRRYTWTRSGRIPIG